MGIKEICICEERNGNSIYLYKEGSFWKAYEHSAYLFVKHVRPYSVKLHYYKNVEQEIISIGFPDVALNKIIENRRILIQKEKEITIGLDENLSENEYLRGLVPVIRTFLEKELALNLHPRKIVLQHYDKGVRFVGAFILPNRIYIERRTKGSLYQKIAEANKRIKSDPDGFQDADLHHFFSSVNSYLGFMRHYKTYKLRKKMLYRLSVRFDKHFRPAAAYTKLKKISKIENLVSDNQIKI